jgi:hypothetical protein
MHQEHGKLAPEVHEFVDLLVFGRLVAGCGFDHCMLDLDKFVVAAAGVELEFEDSGEFVLGNVADHCVLDNLLVELRHVVASAG